MKGVVSHLPKLVPKHTYDGAPAAKCRRPQEASPSIGLDVDDYVNKKDNYRYIDIYICILISILFIPIISNRYHDRMVEISIYGR